ncbi:MAG: peptidoglycan bridge formation glycyltransferase FemA/FemB family protein [Dehalococcoidales bacterium]|jgi:FemAB-related protein (PEP-CTERM system-associated)|nr:peptidoglycan bridge formation glycyltransferase FemA/FemB family protein [Dehalococcoidales bacterium]
MERANNLSITYKVNPLQWEEYVASKPDGKIYHLPQWNCVLANSFGYKPFNIFALDGNENVCGILPLMLVKSWLTGNRLVSLPFSHIGGPLFDFEAALIELIKEAIALKNRLRASNIEIRTIEGTETSDLTEETMKKAGFLMDETFSTFILDITNVEQNWKKLNPKSTRWAIRKAAKQGVVANRVPGVSGLKAFYKLNVETKSRLGVPAHPSAFFRNILNGLNENHSLYLAEYKQAVIAGMLNLEFNNSVIYGYSASTTKHRKYNATSLLIWAAIESAIHKGIKQFDFGRASRNDCGLSSFKKHWGAQQIPLKYYYYPSISSTIRLEEGFLYDLVTRIWKIMPAFLTETLSKLLFRHLG